ncbi:hypothetical protein B296_00040816 [Ensete ventricosum]|uniref:Uncharacterized protein n=1 Tax=Ensete ventricosum TaxID=4639 RepID=A0A426Y700_ENSVE|nr:hypothetical protein B296_00040816 [Ensete ventricosum]
MSGQPQGGSPPQHSLAFRVMRLCRPSFQAEDAVLRLLDPVDLLAPEDLLDDPTLPLDILFDDATGPDAPAANGDFTFRDRFQIRSPVDAMSLSGLLVLPQSFGFVRFRPRLFSFLPLFFGCES